MELLKSKEDCKEKYGFWFAVVIWFLVVLVFALIIFSSTSHALDRDKICSTFNFTYSECDEFMSYLIANDTVIENYTYVINNTIVKNYTTVLNYTYYLNTTINRTINITNK